MVNASIITPYGQRWLAGSREVRILHLFENACNLVNASRDVLSLVTPAVGAGPFAVVVPELNRLLSHLTITSAVSPAPERLQIGEWVIEVGEAVIWSPTFPWPADRRQGAFWTERLTAVDALLTPRLQAVYREDGEQTAVHLWRQLEAGLNQLIEALKAQDAAAIRASSQRLAGLGPGLTPAGDDMLMGTMYAAWLCLPAADCRPLVTRIGTTAAPRTTTLSAAWLQAAMRGEVTALWLAFLQSFIKKGGPWTASLSQILETGHSSGVDAIYGFRQTVAALGLPSAIEQPT